ncbi:hypothetical protein DSM106972_040300 [Dulcicalothrix desertica PCC 7102]|uniref:Uncharacterized protein n=1 Tax=Dulcicalothrix desertica PCC 7102 TaxID=232991 RepID=A0A3S1AN69_9CYAN|nr:hypothetical protein [Dulcicalothrix desertica]RUT05209.1 hypothetical protein DSM106972_040300 [Dulcicalothrix desertica PCC 7102]TWH43286.1 hypothetical protein CAL7102_06996 [Dulcicalothrix desertica PCC 7102]
MKKIISKSKKLFSWLVPYKISNLYIPLSLEKLQQILIDISETGIVEKIPVLFGAIDVKYHVRLINEDFFKVEGPFMHKRVCLLTQGKIMSEPNTNGVIIELKMRLLDDDIKGSITSGLFILICLITLGGYKSPVNVFIIMTLLSFIFYGVMTINFHYEASNIKKILAQKLTI